MRSLVIFLFSFALTYSLAKAVMYNYLAGKPVFARRR